MNANAKEFVGTQTISNTRFKRYNIELQCRNAELERIIKQLQSRNIELEKIVNESTDAIFMYEMKICELMKDKKESQ